MNLERASERAYSVSGPKSAARLYNDIEYELALGEPDDRSENLGEQALALLEGRFPGVQKAARQIEEAPRLSRRAGDALHGVHRRTPQPPQAARQHQSKGGPLPRRSWNRVYDSMHAHPVCAFVIITFFIIVVVKVWAYIALGAIALAALNAYEPR